MNWLKNLFKRNAVPTGAWYDIFEGYDSAEVPETVMLCIRMIANTLSNHSLDLYHKETDNSRIKLTKREDVRVKLTRKPNKIMYFDEFVERFLIEYYWNGQAVILKQYNGLGEVVGLKIIPNESITFRSEEYFSISLVNEGSRDIPYDDLIVLTFNPDPLLPQTKGGVKAAYRKLIDVESQIQTMQSSMFKNGMFPLTVLKTDHVLEEEARENIRSSLKNLYSGASNAGRSMLLEEGLDLQAIGVNFRDLTLHELRSLNLSLIANIFGIPSAMLSSMIGAVTYSNLNESYRQYLVNAVLPIAYKLSEAFNMELLDDSEEDLYWDWNLLDQLSILPAERYEIYTKAIEKGIMTPEEVRERENLSKKKGTDILHFPLNTAYLKDGEIVNPNADKGGETNGNGKANPSVSSSGE